MRVVKERDGGVVRRVRLVDGDGRGIDGSCRATGRGPAGWCRRPSLRVVVVDGLVRREVVRYSHGMPVRLTYRIALTISRKSCTRAAVPGPVRPARQAVKTGSIKVQRVWETSLRYGGRALIPWKVDADQARIDVEVEAMPLAPVPTRRSCGASRPCSRPPHSRGRRLGASAGRRPGRRRRGPRRAPPSGSCTTRRRSGSTRPAGRLVDWPAASSTTLRGARMSACRHIRRSH